MRPRPAAAARDPPNGFTREDAGFFVDGFTLDQKGLADAGKVEVGIERRAAPNAARFDAAMIEVFSKRPAPVRAAKFAGCVRAPSDHRVDPLPKDRRISRRRESS